jgi:hypothetical protein
MAANIRDVCWSGWNGEGGAGDREGKEEEMRGEGKRRR